MGRRPKFNLSWELDHELLELNNFNMEEEAKRLESFQNNFLRGLENTVALSQQMMNSEVNESSFLSVTEAYRFLKQHNHPISFRAFGGRIERGEIPSVRKDNRRYIPIKALEWLLFLDKNYYTVRQLYERYKSLDPNLTFRAFIGRVEKGTVPSIKIGSRRFIPKRVGDLFLKLAANYFTVSQALEEMKKAGIDIKRNTLERRLDRGRVPFIKIGGKRYIPKDVLYQLIEQEKK
jgi:hypothetical protein